MGVLAPAALLAALLVVAAAPGARAAQGVYCTALDGSGVALALTLGAGPAHPVLAAVLETPDSGESHGAPPMVAQAFLGAEWLAVTLADPESAEIVAEARVLRVETGRQLHQYGYLRRGDQVHPVACEGP